MELKGYFPTGILTHQVADKVSNYIESIIVSRLESLENAQKYCNDNIQTDFYKSDRIISRKELTPLTNEINKCVKYYADTVGQSANNFEYWVQDYNKNQFHGLHNHGRSTLFSVVYWVRASENAGSLVIEESNPLKKLWFQNLNNISPFKYTEVKFQPKKGYLLIFPGYLEHKTLSSETNCVRTTIAFNYS